jgi:hypothetical protein
MAVRCVKVVLARAAPAAAPAGGDGVLGAAAAAAGTSWLTAADVGALHRLTVDVLSGGVCVPPAGGGASAEGEGDAAPSGGECGLNAADALLACARTDRADGLLPTVVCDRAGVALGLVYSSEASVRNPPKKRSARRSQRALRAAHTTVTRRGEGASTRVIVSHRLTRDPSLFFL